MKKENTSRSYQMVARAEAVNATTQRIQEATFQLWQQHPFHEITLDMIAEKAGVSVRTLLRRYGSRDQLFESCIGQDSGGIMARREQVSAGDTEEVVRVLMEDYEENGDANIRTLAAEQEFAVFGKMLCTAREYHRNWLARVFAPYLPAPEHPEYDTRLDAFYAATEVYLWKVLRRDFKRSPKETENVFKTLIYSIIPKNGTSET